MQQNLPGNRPDSPSQSRSPDEKRLVILSATPSQLALYVALLLTFFALVWGFLIWYEVDQGRSNGVYDTIRAIIIGTGQAGFAAIIWTAMVLTTGNWVITAAKWKAKR